MHQQEPDQIGQHLKTNIEGFFSQTPADDVPRIEYRPLFMALLEMPSEEHYQNDQQETST